METAAIIVMTIPGYVCRPTSPAHKERLTHRFELLSRIEADLKRSIAAAEPLATASESLVQADRRMRCREAVRIAVRTTVRHPKQ